MTTESANSYGILSLKMESSPRTLAIATIENSSNGTERIAEKNFACRYSLFYLRFLGLWADDSLKPSRFSILTGYFGALVTVGIFGFHFTLLTEDANGEIIAKFFSEFLVALTSIAKVLPIILIRKNILKIWQETYHMRSIPKEYLEEKEIADGWYSFQCKLVKLLIRFYILAMIIYQMIPWFDGGKLPLKGAYPEWAKNSPWFYPIYIVTTAASMLRDLSIIACDLCVLIAMCQLFGELQLVQHLISNVEQNNRKALQRAVMRHAIVLDYGRIICDNFSLVFMFLHFNVSMSISFLSAVFLYTSDFNLLMNLTLFMVLYTSQLAIVCFAGEKLMQESSKITSSIESSYDKFLNDVPSLKLMTTMLMRAQEPLHFNFGSTCLNLRYCSQTLNAIYSFTMILKSTIK